MKKLLKRIECKRIDSGIMQFNKMSRLEFVAIQFGVKLSIAYKLC